MRWEGSRFGISATGDVWVEGSVADSEPPALWHLLEAHAAGWRAIEGTRKRLPAHRLKLCTRCGVAVLAAATVTRCRCCKTKRKLVEVRMAWAGEG